MKENVYLPSLARIVDMKLESAGSRPIKTFRLELVDEKKKAPSRNQPPPF